MPDPGGYPDFSAQLIAWQERHGRHSLPWQNTRDPYAIWVSEIMLQQTQVSAVIPYYQRFMASFPDVGCLAGADEEAVLRHWSGLGYYSRARNLHSAAQIIAASHDGRFPGDFDAILALPGIGRSTAAAICVFAFGERQAILDGNVKRVFARCFGVAGWPGLPAVERQLWEIAQKLLPEVGIEAYTQGLMDLGATVCTRTRPSCSICPLSSRCAALRTNQTGALPAPKPRKALPERETVMLLLRHEGEILLEKRPSAGIWGGLWSLPEVGQGADMQQLSRERFGLEVKLLPPLARLSHTFTHFRLHIVPQPLDVIGRRPIVQEPGTLWLGLEDAVGAAVPTPVRTLIQRLR